MSAPVYVPSGPIDVTRQVQYYEETNYLQYNSNPVFQNAGVVMRFNTNDNNDSEQIRILGSADLYSNILMGKTGTFEIGYRLLDTKLLRYGTEAPGGSGTIEKGLTFLVSRKVNDVEQFRLYRGCLTERVTITIERMVDVTHEFFCPDISNWMSLATLKGLLGVATTSNIQFAANITGDPWTNLRSGTNAPLTIGGTNYDNMRLTVEFVRNIIKQQPSGYPLVKYARAGNREISGTFETWLSGTALNNLVTAFTAQQLVYRLKGPDTPVCDLTIDGVKFTANSDTTDAGANDFNTQSLSFTGTTGSVTNV